MMVFVEVNYCFGGRSYFYKLILLKVILKKGCFVVSFLCCYSIKGLILKRCKCGLWMSLCEKKNMWEREEYWLLSLFLFVCFCRVRDAWYLRCNWYLENLMEKEECWYVMLKNIGASHLKVILWQATSKTKQIGAW